MAPIGQSTRPSASSSGRPLATASSSRKVAAVVGDAVRALVQCTLIRRAGLLRLRGAACHAQRGLIALTLPDLMPEESVPRRAAEAARSAAQAGRELVSIRGTGLLSSGLPAPASSFTLPKGSVVALPAMGQVLLRVVEEPIEAASFVSRQILGRRPFTDEAPILFAGVSMFADLAQVLTRFRRSPVVAEVTLEEGCGFHLAKTLGKGHFTVWGDPDRLASRAHVIHRAS